MDEPVLPAVLLAEGGVGALLERFIGDDLSAERMGIAADPEHHVRVALDVAEPPGVTGPDQAHSVHDREPELGDPLAHRVR
jgi:hypothetical protein